MTIEEYDQTMHAIEKIAKSGELILVMTMKVDEQEIHVNINQTVFDISHNRQGCKTTVSGFSRDMTGAIKEIRRFILHYGSVKT